MTVEYHPAVEHELAAVRDYYEQQLPGLGREFIDEFERQVVRIAAKNPPGRDHAAGIALATSVMYLRVTQAVGRAEPSFAAHQYLAHLDAVFARLYFAAYDDWRAGRRAAVPLAWQIAFEASDSGRVTGVGDLLLGMNAHISRDLPFAVRTAGAGGAGTVADRLRGTPGRRVLPIEQDVRKVSRQSLVLRRALNPGDLLREGGPRPDLRLPGLHW